MIDWLLRCLAPHICEGCGAVGATLCKRCNFNILQSKWTKCVNCGRKMTIAEIDMCGNMCDKCGRSLPFDKVFVVGERTKILRKLVGNYKYFSRRESARAMADLLDKTLSEILPPDLTVVPLPTVPKHIRERGFDHMKLVARRLSRRRGLTNAPGLLRRTNNISQHSANFRQRQKQATTAFSVKNCTIPQKVLLIDDIYTTGATTSAAAKLLKKHGAQEIWLGIVARHIRK